MRRSGGALPEAEAGALQLLTGSATCLDSDETRQSPPAPMTGACAFRTSRGWLLFRRVETRTPPKQIQHMVVKALSWALRELATREPERVRHFIREEDGRLASRVRREVTSKLETGRKTRKIR
jgi:hypothetical protein